VHERGAPHLIDPSKLIRSATRLYQQDMAQWGEILPVPAANVHALGERVDLTVAGRTFDVRWAPGHASHHVVYFEPATGVAYVGDNAGIRRPGSAAIVPPTPPPDIDLEAWRESLAKLRAWQPQTVFITHFGPYGDVPAHLAHLEKSLTDVAEMARRAMDREASDEEKYAQFKREVEAYVHASGVTDSDERPLEHVGPLEFNWRGLVRYWTKRGTQRTGN
jgi:glyoxylase-like metal-dependent hydrolase (beta-lactamase superfamily II)